MRSLFGFLSGITLTFLAILLELKDYNQDMTFENILDLIDHHSIFKFAIIFLPFSCALITFLVFNFYEKNKFLLKEQKYIEAVFNTVGDIILVVDDEKIVSHNPALKEFYHNCLHDLNTKNFESKVIELSKKEFHEEFEYFCDDGQKLNFLINTNSMNGEKDEILKIVSLKNISEVIQKREIIEDQQRKIQNSSRLSSLGEMAGGIAHEINNPLAVIKGWTARLERMDSPENIDFEKLNKGVLQINKTVDRISTITKTLLRLSNSERKNAKESICVKEAFSSVLSLAHAKIRDNNVQVTIEETNLKDRKFLVSRVEVEQIILNLISNSVDALVEVEQEEKIITLKAITNSKSLIFSVTDNGPGIPDNIVDRIFEPMFTTKPVGKGTGLGLSLCYSMAQDLQGELLLSQFEGETSFLLILPKEESFEEEEKKSA